MQPSKDDFDIADFENTFYLPPHPHCSSLERVERYGLLGGLSRDDLRFTGSTSVKLQEGVEDFLVKTSQRGIPIHICSANWSKDLIIGALQHLTDGKAVKLANVASSDLEFDERGSMLSTGKIRRNIVTADDKKKYLEDIRKTTKSEGRIVYIGDGQPDVLAMLNADVGIIVGDGSSLRKTAEMARGVQLLTASAQCEFDGLFDALSSRDGNHRYVLDAQKYGESVYSQISGETSVDVAASEKRTWSLISDMCFGSPGRADTTQ